MCVSTIKTAFNSAVSAVKSVFEVKGQTTEEVVFPEAPKYYPLPNGEFPLLAGYGFYDPFMTDQQYEWAKDCGFNVIGKSLSLAKTTESIEKAKKYGLYVRVSTGYNSQVNRIPEVAALYKNNPWVWQFSSGDEPSADEFPGMAEIQKKWLELVPNQNVAFNLLPAVEPERLGSKDYKTHVEDFVKIVNPAFIGYDCYPISVNSNGSLRIGSCIWQTIEVIRDVAKRSKRPFLTYILTNKHWSYPKPTVCTIGFQLYLALAYGCQGIFTWTYCHPDFDKTGEFSDAPIDLNGNRTSSWYALKEVLQEFKKYQHVFLGCNVTNVFHEGFVPTGCKKLDCNATLFSKISSKSSDGIVVSTFNNKEHAYTLIVSKNVNSSQEVEVTPKNNAKMTLLNDGSTFSTKKTLTLAPGGMALIQTA